jgi:hypothetical protein
LPNIDHGDRAAGAHRCRGQRGRRRNASDYSDRESLRGGVSERLLRTMDDLLVVVGQTGLQGFDRPM